MIRFKKNCKRLRVGIKTAKSQFAGFLEAFDDKKINEARTYLETTLYWVDDLRSVRFDAERSIKILLNVLQEAGMAHDIDSAREWLDNNVEISEESQYIIIDGDFDLKGGFVTELPSNMSIQGNAELSPFYGDALPYGLYVNGNLYLATGVPNLKTLPSGLSIGRDLHIDFTQIESIPASIFVGGDLYVGKKLEKRAEQLKKMGKIRGKIFIRG